MTALVLWYNNINELFRFNYYTLTSGMAGHLKHRCLHIGLPPCLDPVMGFASCSEGDVIYCTGSGDELIVCSEQLLFSPGFGADVFFPDSLVNHRLGDQDV